MKTILVALLTLGIGFSAQAETWKFASEEDKNDVQDAFALKFAEVIKQESGGDIKVRIYYFGQLGTENDIVELTAKGTIQFVSVGTGHLGSYVPEVQVISLPYLLGTNEPVVREILTGSETIYKELADKFQNANLKLLTMFSEGEMVWGANKAIVSPEDFAGQKIRTFTSTIPVKTYKTFGATPTPLSWGEVYGSLQLKTVDGMVNPIYFIYNAKWHEVQTHLMFPGQQVYVGTVSASSKWFNGLSDDKKSMIMKAVKAGEEAAYEYNLRINEENMEKIMKERPEMQIVRLTEEQRSRFEELSNNLHGTYFNIVENAYKDPEKASARKGAETILANLIAEVNEAYAKAK